MSKTFKDSPKYNQDRTRRGSGRQRNISVRAVRREQPDLRKLARALIQLASAEAQAAGQGAATEVDGPAADEVAHD